MNGKHEVLSITIKPEAVDPDDIEMLEDMVAAAINATVQAGGRDRRSRDGQADRRPEHSGSLSREGEIPWTTLPHRWKS